MALLGIVVIPMMLYGCLTRSGGGTIIGVVGVENSGRSFPKSRLPFWGS